MTIVFSDLKGSTAMGEKLDSESLREVMTRYFDAMSAELEKHGGVVEKFIGDAIMAVFGLPKLHEDDALRAVRAAADMQRAQAVLNDELERHWGVRLTVRTGVNTGAGRRRRPDKRAAARHGGRRERRRASGAGRRRAGGAARRPDLPSRARLRGRRAGRAARAEGEVRACTRVPPLSVREDAERPRRLDAPMVGRDAELELLHAALEEATAERRCRLVTVIGEAGVGKSRLIDEFVRSVEGRGVVPPWAVSRVRRRHYVLAARRGCSSSLRDPRARLDGGSTSEAVRAVRRRRSRSARRLRDRAVAGAVHASRSSSGEPASCSRRSRVPGLSRALRGRALGRGDVPRPHQARRRRSRKTRRSSSCARRGTSSSSASRSGRQGPERSASSSSASREEEAAAVAENLLGRTGLDDRVRVSRGRGRRRQSALRRAAPVDADRRRSDRVRGRLLARGAGYRPRGRSADDPGTPGRAPRLSRSGRTDPHRACLCHRTRVRQGRRELPRSGPRPRRSRRTARRAYREAACSSGPLALAGGGGVPLPSHPHPRHGVRRDSQARPSDLPRAVRRVGGQRQPRRRYRVRGDPRLPPRAGPPLSRRSWARSTITAVISASMPRGASPRRGPALTAAATCLRPRTCCDAQASSIQSTTYVAWS